MSIEIGNRVRQIRANSGLNQREFASRLGISSGGISQIESGKAMPGGDFLLRIHQEFNVDITWLLTGMSMIEPKVNSTELPKEKRALLDAFDGMSADDKKTLLRVGESLSQPKPSKFAS